MDGITISKKKMDGITKPIWEGGLEIRQMRNQNDASRD